MQVDIKKLLDARPEVVYKSDARSRVWCAADGGERLVVKRFVYSPLRQLLGWCLGIHPAQLEARGGARLDRAGLRRVPILRRTRERAGLGLRLCLVYPWQGESLFQRMRAGHPGDDDAAAALPWPARAALTERVAALAAELLDAGLVHRDLKPTNILIGDDGDLRLIDAGGVRRLRRRRQAWRMLAVLDRTAARAGATRTDRLRCLKAIARRHPNVGTWRAAARAVQRAA